MAQRPAPSRVAQIIPDPNYKAASIDRDICLLRVTREPNCTLVGPTLDFGGSANDYVTWE